MLRRPGRSEGLLAKTAGAERSAGKAPQKNFAPLWREAALLVQRKSCFYGFSSGHARPLIILTELYSTILQYLNQPLIESTRGTGGFLPQGCRSDSSA